jgi:3-dehydroquinate dehydratase-2
MPEYSLLVLNGPNLGHLGQRQPEIYGTRGMDDLSELLSAMLGPRSRDLEITQRQANGEGQLIDILEQARTDGIHGVAFNAGAYTHTSLALADCLAWIGIPCVEVHLSNVLARTEEPLRQISRIGKQCIGVISGFGLDSYVLAIFALIRHLDASKNRK